MQITAAELAALLKGEVIGDAGVSLHTVAKIEEGFTGALSFLSNPKYESFLYETKSSVVLINADFVPAKPVSATLIKVPNAYTAFTFLLEKFASQAASDAVGVDPKAIVDSQAKLGKNVYVGAGVVIDQGAEIGDNCRIFPGTYIGRNVKLGADSILYANVTIYHACEIGHRTIIHSGTVIGSDGFGHAPQADGSYKKIPQTGNVIIGNDVEIGSNCSIDRATMGSTIIRDGVRLDNLIQVAHNVEIGEHTVIAAQTGISGSSKIGKHCMIGGQVGIAGHIEIADHTIVAAQAGVIANLKGNQKYFGTPAIDLNQYMKSYVYFRKLPDIMKRLETLEKQLKSSSNETN